MTKNYNIISDMFNPENFVKESGIKLTISEIELLELAEKDNATHVIERITGVQQKHDKGKLSPKEHGHPDSGKTCVVWTKLNIVPVVCVFRNDAYRSGEMIFKKNEVEFYLVIE